VALILDSKTPEGPLADKWDKHKFDLKLVAPHNRRKFEVIVVGSGLAGAAAAASLGEAGYNVSVFTYHDSPRRAHSIAAQGGINGAKNYKNDGDSIQRLFYDTIKGGDYRSRESNVYRLAQSSVNIIDQATAQGVPFAREYGGLLDNRSFGGAQVSRTFYARGQTGQQLLLGAYQALARQIQLGTVTLYNRMDMQDVVVHDGRAIGITARDLLTGEISAHSAHAVLLATGGYGNVYFLSTNAKACNVTATWRAHKKGAAFANPCFTQIHPTCIPPADEFQSKLTLMSESLRNDGRIWVPSAMEETRAPGEIQDADRDYFLERKYPAFGNLVPRDVASRAAKERCDAGFGVNATGEAVYLDFASAIMRYGKTAATVQGVHNATEDQIRELGTKVVEGKYGNLFQMYEQIVAENPYKMPMMIYPAVHYTMGGLWVDYELMTTVTGCYACGEANFSDHGANRLGASALMQGLADGYFVLPYTIGNYLADEISTGAISTKTPEFVEAEKAVRERLEGLFKTTGTETVDTYHKKLGKIIWDYCGMARSKEGLEFAISEIRKIREDFYKNVKVPGGMTGVNTELEKATRVADFIELGELMCLDALDRDESCGGHFREEFQTEEGEALRVDDKYSYVAAWEFTGDPSAPKLNKEDLIYENIKVQQRSYK
jgi:succinate dehydrogenase / fumarate reductase flavoprotein subunit